VAEEGGRGGGGDGGDMGMLTPESSDASEEDDETTTSLCSVEVSRRLELGREAQRLLYENRHPPDCANAKFLVCRSTFRQAAYLCLGARELDAAWETDSDTGMPMGGGGGGGSGRMAVGPEDGGGGGGGAVMTATHPPTRTALPLPPPPLLPPPLTTPPQHAGGAALGGTAAAILHARGSGIGGLSGGVGLASLGGTGTGIATAADIPTDTASAPSPLLGPGSEAADYALAAAERSAREAVVANTRARQLEGAPEALQGCSLPELRQLAADIERAGARVRDVLIREESRAAAEISAADATICHICHARRIDTVLNCG